MITKNTHDQLITAFKIATDAQRVGNTVGLAAALGGLNAVLDHAYPNRAHDVAEDLQTVDVLQGDTVKTELLCDVTRETYALGVLA